MLDMASVFSDDLANLYDWDQQSVLVLSALSVLVVVALVLVYLLASKLGLAPAAVVFPMMTKITVAGPQVQDLHYHQHHHPKLQLHQ